LFLLETIYLNPFSRFHYKIERLGIIIKEEENEKNTTKSKKKNEPMRDQAIKQSNSVQNANIEI